MNNLRIDYDGRITAWNSDITTLRSPKAPLLRQSEEWELFCDLPDEGKVEFLHSLGSSHVINSENVSELYEPKARRGSKGISSYGRSQVRCAAQWLEDRFELKHLSFLTCTLPPEALVAYTSETWAEVVHRYVKWLRYHLGRAGLCPFVVAVTEIQMNRWKAERGLPPVHLHLLFQGRQPGCGWAYRPDFYQAGWQQSCQSVWACHWVTQSSTRVESLRSSSVSYLGKYMSKGNGAIDKACLGTLPTSWYSISTELKVLIKSLVLKLSGQAAHDLYEYLYSGDMMLWQRSVMSDYSDSGTCYLMAWIGAIRGRSNYWEIINDIRPVIRSIALSQPIATW